jgi:carboxylesterase
MMKKKSILILLVFGFIIFISYLLNETTVLYHEPSAYQISAQDILMSPLAAPISNQTPKRDTLILFLHSYASSPHDFARAAEHFSNQYNVLVPRYPGHGTTEQEFQKTYFSQWYALARDTYLQQRPNYAHVYLCGFSMGGAIALKLGEEFSETNSPDGIITIASPVFLNHLSTGVLYDWRLYFTRIFSWVMPIVPYTAPGTDLDGADRIGYDGKDFLAQVHSLKMGLKPVAENLGKIKCPVLCMQSRGDETAPFDNLFYIARHVSSQFVRVRVFDLRAWRHSRHLLPLYASTRDQVIEEIENYMKSVTSSASEPARTPASVEQKMPAGDQK